MLVPTYPSPPHAHTLFLFYLHHRLPPVVESLCNYKTWINYMDKHLTKDIVVLQYLGSSKTVVCWLCCVVMTTSRGCFREHGFVDAVAV